MSTEPTEQPAETTPPEGTPQAPEKPAEPPKAQTLEELLADLDDDRRKVILEQVSKPRNEAKNLRDRLKALEPKAAEYDKLAEASKTDLEKAQEAASKATERISALTSRAVKSEVKALAAESFADPSDASAFLDLSQYADENGEIDTESIKADLADLLARKPHLGKGEGSRIPRPNPAQGSSGSGPAKAAQLTEQDVQRLYRERRYDEIEKARTEGRLNNLLGA